VLVFNHLRTLICYPSIVSDDLASAGISYTMCPYQCVLHLFVVSQMHLLVSRKVHSIRQAQVQKVFPDRGKIEEKEKGEHSRPLLSEMTL
jgi:hypothetical protein